jgi:hypothetical protein
MKIGCNGMTNMCYLKNGMKKQFIIRLCAAVSLCLIFAAGAQAKVKAPFSLNAAIVNGPTAQGEAEIEVTASSIVARTFELKCKYGRLQLIEGETPVSFSLGADESRTFIYRFSLPKPDDRYKVWFTLRTARGMAVKALVDINKPEEKPPGRVKKLPSGEGVRELGP